MALIRDMLFDNATAVNTHTEEQLQSLMGHFSQACQDFSLTISLKKTKVMGKYVKEISAMTINNYELEIVHQFAYLGSNITYNVSLEVSNGCG